MTMTTFEQAEVAVRERIRTATHYYYYYYYYWWWWWYRWYGCLV